MHCTCANVKCECDCKYKCGMCVIIKLADYSTRTESGGIVMCPPRQGVTISRIGYSSDKEFPPPLHTTNACPNLQAGQKPTGPRPPMYLEAALQQSDPALRYALAPSAWL